MNLSSGGKLQIRTELKRSTELSDQEIDSVLQGLGVAAKFASAVQLPESPTATRRELELLVKATDAVLAAADKTTVHAEAAMLNAVFMPGRDPDPEGFDGGKLGSELVALRRCSLRINTAAKRALSLMTVPKNRPRNIPAHNLARHVAAVLKNNGVQVKTTTNGVYLNVLDVVFHDCFPELGEGAYRRYGLDAVANPKLYEVSLDFD